MNTLSDILYPVDNIISQYVSLPRPFTSQLLSVFVRCPHCHDPIMVSNLAGRWELIGNNNVEGLLPQWGRFYIIKPCFYGLREFTACEQCFNYNIIQSRIARKKARRKRKLEQRRLSKD